MDERVEELPLGRLLDSVAARTTAPGGGAVAGVVAALAGALTAMCARFSGSGPADLADLADLADMADLARRADELRFIAVELAQADLAVYAVYVHARAAGDAGELAAALDETIRIPLEVAEVSVELAEMAHGLSRSGNPNLRADATTAALIGAAAARAAAVLVAENLAGACGDPRLARAAAIVAAANGTERDALSLFPALAPH